MDHVLALDDPRWNTLMHRAGIGPTSEIDIAAELAALYTMPEDVDRIRDLWPYLASEGSTWDAAYAALPHLVHILRRQEPALRGELLSFVGIILTGGSVQNVPDDLRTGFESALTAVYEPLGESLSVLSAEDLPWVLATIAALRGNVVLAEVLQEPDAVEATCDECGAEVTVEIPGLA